MLKFFRKYNKIILVVGGCLLMIVFLLPQAAQQFGPNPARIVVARYDGGEVSALQRQKANQEIEGVLERLNPAIPDILGLRREAGVDRGMHWLLLTHEAEAGGYVGGVQDGRDFLTQVAKTLTLLQYGNLLQYLGPEQAAGILRGREEELIEMFEQGRLALINGGATEQYIDSVFARARGVLRLYEAYLDAPKYSDLEAMALAANYLDEVGFAYVLLTTDEVDTGVPEPTEEEIAAHFDRFKDVAPGEGEHGFGYRLRPALQIQWLRVDRAAVEGAVAVDPIEAHTYWKQNRDTYPGEAGQERARVERELRQQAADRAMDEIALVVRAELQKAVGSLPQDGRYKELPPDWAQRMPAYEAIAQTVAERMSAKLGAEVPAPEVRSSDGWLTAEELAQAANIGRSFIQAGPTRVPFAELAMSVRELGQERPLWPPVQVGMTGPPTRDAAGSLYFFRPTAARGESVPTDAAQVRESIVRDLRRLAAWRILQDNTAIYEGGVANLGMDAFAEQTGVPMVRPATATREGVRISSGQPPFDSEPLRDAIMERASRFDPRRPINDVPRAERILSVPLPDVLGLAVVEIDRLTPLTYERFRENQEGVLQTASQQQQSSVLQGAEAWPFSWNLMRERWDFAYTREGEEEDDDAAAEPAADATASAAVAE